jgi:hypothetical protein
MVDAAADVGRCPSVEERPLVACQCHRTTSDSAPVSALTQSTRTLSRTLRLSSLAGASQLRLSPTRPDPLSRPSSQGVTGILSEDRYTHQSQPAVDARYHSSLLPTTPMFSAGMFDIGRDYCVTRIPHHLHLAPTREARRLSAPACSTPAHSLGSHLPLTPAC